MSIVTKGGDKGETGLLYGGRVRKDDLHTQAYGALDEAISALGMARAQADQAQAEKLLALQRELFTAGAELATDKDYRAKLVEHFAAVDSQMVENLEAQIKELEATVPLPQSFIIPGGTMVAACIDLARTFVRRAERWTVALWHAGKIDNPELLSYLNRLSDLLFMLAREAEQGAITAKDVFGENG